MPSSAHGDVPRVINLDKARKEASLRSAQLPVVWLMVFFCITPNLVSMIIDESNGMQHAHKWPRSDSYIVETLREQKRVKNVPIKVGHEVGLQPELT